MSSWKFPGGAREKTKKRDHSGRTKKPSEFNRKEEKPPKNARQRRGVRQTNTVKLEKSEISERTSLTGKQGKSDQRGKTVRGPEDVLGVKG